MWLTLLKDQHHTHHILIPKPLNRSIARHSKTRYITGWTRHFLGNKMPILCYCIAHLANASEALKVLRCVSFMILCNLHLFR